jgi:hypothetical protein
VSDASGDSRMLLDAARDLEMVTARHAPLLRGAGLDEVAERLEEIVMMLQSRAQELEAAMQPAPASAPPGEGVWPGAGPG